MRLTIETDDLPETWKIKPLGECATVQTGIAKGRRVDPEEAVSVPYLRVANVQDGYLDLSEIKTIELRRGEVDRYRLQPGDIVLTEGGDLDKLGRGYVWSGEIHECVHQNHVFAVRVDRSELDPNFFSYQAQSPYGKSYFLSVAHKTTNLACINTTKLKAFPVLIPPLPEQKAIAHTLCTVQRAIEAQERIIQTTTELKKALMQKLFTEGLRGEPQKETEIGLVPESWEVVAFADSISIQSGQVDPRQHPFVQMPHVGPENIESDTGQLTKLNTNGELKISSGNYHFTTEDVLYSKIRPYLNKVALPDFEGTCSADMYPLRSKTHFTREFLFYYLLSDKFKETAMSFQDRTGIPKINRAQLGSIHLACPAKEEQSEITEVLFSIDSRCAIAQHTKSQLHDLFRTLLHELMTRKTRAHNFTPKST